MASFGRKSFLDELLADEPGRLDVTKRTSTSASAGKSVRFIDNEDILEAISAPSSSGKVRTTSSTITSEKQESRTSSMSSTKGNRRSNWLGLLEDDGSKASSGLDSAPRLQKDDKDDDHWLDEGLTERRSKEKKLSEEARKSGENESWLDFKKQVQGSRKSDGGSSVKSEVDGNLEVSSSVNMPQSQPVSGQAATSDSQAEGRVDVMMTNQKEILILQAKVDILKMEKDHLLTSIDQMKGNHQAEINILKTLHEQQMSMTSDVYKKQEEMLREERDRRIKDLKQQLETSEKEREKLRIKYNEKVDSIEHDCREEVEKLKEMHKSMVKRLTEQHEADIERIRRIKGQEIEALTALQDQSSSLEVLVNKWQANADRIENLHRTLINKEEEILKTKVDSLESKDRRLDLIEENWLSLKREVEREKISYDEAKEKLMKLLEEQRNMMTNEQSRLIEEKKVLEEARKKLVEERARWEEEVNKCREKLDRESKEIKGESEKIQEKMMELERREGQIILKEIDWKHEMSREKEDMNRMQNEMQEDRRNLLKERSLLQEAVLNLQSEQQKLESKKILFDSEKEKLRQAAEKLADNARQLEILEQVSSKEREDGKNALEAAMRVKEETDQKLERIERKASQLAKETMRIQMEEKRIQQEWRALQETKHSIVCNLCGNGLSRVKFRNDVPMVPNFYHANNAYSNIEDNDRMLLIWQISAQQDAALLAEETAFVTSLRNDGNQYNEDD